MAKTLDAFVGTRRVCLLKSTIKQRIFFCLCVFLGIFFISCSAFGNSEIQVIPKYDMSQYDKEITAIYQKTNSQNLNLAEKINQISAIFLSKPYEFDALGEGEKASFDKDPLYRTDKFDCMTFASTILALTKSHNLTEFQKNIKKINYKNGKVSYLNRNHFTNIDWNKNNAKNGFIKDITDEIFDEEYNQVAEISRTTINKPKWLQMRTQENIKYFAPISENATKKILQKMHSLSAYTKPTESVIYYLPLNKLFDKDNKPNMYLFQQISTPAILEIVSSHPNLKKQIGTDLDVAHMGLILKISNQLIFREASSDTKFGNGVIDVPLITYLANSLTSHAIKGINIEKIL
jgi:hypothetical protein